MNMTAGFSPPTNSPTAALLTAAAVGAAGIAYWSSGSNTSAFGTLVLEILRATGTIKEDPSPPKKSVKYHKAEQEEMSKTDKDMGNDMEKEFISWLEKEARDKNYSHHVASNDASVANSLNDPHWMSEMLRNALLFVITTDAAAAETVTLSEKGLSTLPASSCKCTEPKKESNLSKSAQTMDNKDNENIFSETAFCHSFRSLQMATKVMIKKEPSIREDFFSGVAIDSSKADQMGETGLNRSRSLSISSSSSSWSTLSSSTVSCDTNKDDCLIEEEQGIERLLAYLRFTELAKEKALSFESPEFFHNKGTFQRKRQRIIPDADGYELLSSIAMKIGDVTDVQRTKLCYSAGVHHYRKELIISIHFDEFSTTGDRKEMETILMSSLYLQQQNHCDTKPVDSQSNPFLLFDKAVQTLAEEILLRYLHTEEVKKSGTASAFLSSGYSLILCGHSLGAALACRLGKYFTHRNQGNVSDAFKVRVFAFGPPPCLSFQPNNSSEDHSYITSVVNNHDCVPRWTKSNLIGALNSLQWIMDRKKRHFKRYYDRYILSKSNINQATGTTTAPVVRRPQHLRIPPFPMHTRERDKFWRSNKEQNGFTPQGLIDKSIPKYEVPGKVVIIWNHSQDYTIIGAKIHPHGLRHLHPRSNGSNQHSHHGNTHKNPDVLGRLWVDEDMFTDHTIEAYRSNLELLLGQVANTI